MHRIRTKYDFLAWMLAGVLLASIIPITISGTASAQSSKVNLNGAGATFPFPLIDTWRVEYQKVNANVNINYQSIGSGGGIRQFTDKTVDFGASDAPLTTSQRSALPAPAVHIPETIGSVVAAYNVIGIPNKGLKLTGPILADIFLGKITKWDDSRIKELNPGLPMPSKDILVVHRSDGSGTTFVWTDYMSKVSDDWKSQVGKGTAVPWPTGIGAPGNEGVANAIRGSAYTIGYIELAYALTTGMQYAFIQNQEGNFIEPSIESTKAAVTASSGALPKGEDSWESVSMTNASGAESYPIASFSYLLVYKEMSNNPQTSTIEEAKGLAQFIEWAVTDGQQFADELSYVPLPEAVVKLDKETLASLTFKNEPVLPVEAPTNPPPTDQECATGYHKNDAGNCVLNEIQQPGQNRTQFTLSSSLDGSSYTMTGRSENVTATSFTINPKESVRIQFDHSGDVELSLPKSMIDGITTIKAGNLDVSYQQLGSSPSITTIRFTVPDGTNTVDIQGAMVVPEFPLPLMLMVASIGAILVAARMSIFGQKTEL